MEIATVFGCNCVSVFCKHSRLLLVWLNWCEISGEGLLCTIPGWRLWILLEMEALLAVLDILCEFECSWPPWWFADLYKTSKAGCCNWKRRTLACILLLCSWFRLGGYPYCNHHIHSCRFVIFKFSMNGEVSRTWGTLPSGLIQLSVHLVLWVKIVHPFRPSRGCQT